MEGVKRCLVWKDHLGYSKSTWKLFGDLTKFHVRLSKLAVEKSSSLQEVVKNMKEVFK